MKNSILNFFAAMMLVVSGVAMADIDCTTAMNGANDTGQTYSTAACECIWTNIYNGCVVARGGPRGCGKQTYNMMHTADDYSIGRTYCSPHSDDPDGCVQSLDYYRGPAGQAPTPFPIPNPALTTYVSHNCPCLTGETCNNT